MEKKGFTLARGGFSDVSIQQHFSEMLKQKRLMRTMHEPTSTSADRTSQMNCSLSALEHVRIA